MKLYGLKNCDSCRAAMKALDGRASLVDVRADGVPEAVLEAAQERFGEALVNTRSTTWRGLSEEERARDPLVLLKEHPALMKRPLIVEGEEMWLGWKGDVKAALGVS